MLTRKPSPKSVLKNLPPEVQDKLGDYLQSQVIESDEKTGKPRVRGRTLAEGVAFAADELKIKTNDSSLSDWFAWWKMMRRFSHYGENADDIENELKQSGFDEDLVPKMGARYFLSKAAEEGDGKTFAAVSAVIQRHLELKAQKAAHADKMALGTKKVQTQRRALRIALRRQRMLEAKVNALEEKNRLATEAAEKAKKGLVGDAAMTPEQRAALVSSLDEIILGVKAKKPEKEKPAP